MSYDILLQHALNLHNNGNLDDAERIYRQILETTPNNPDLLNLLGLIAQAKGVHQEAVELFYKAIKQTPNHAPLYFNLAMSLNEWGKPYEAIDAYLNALSINPNIVEAYNNIGEIYRNLNDINKAKEFYQKAIAADELFLDAKTNLAYVSKDFDSLKKLKTQLAFYYLSLLFQEIGNYDEALEFALQTEEYNQIADLYLIKGNIKKAEIFLKQALIVNPYSVSALINLANIEVGNKNFEAAEAKYKKAIDISPSNLDAHLNYANLLYMDNRPHEALEEYRKAVIINPDIPEISNNIGVIQKDFEEYELALDLFFNAFTKNPNKEEFAINISETLILLVHKDKKDEAIKIAEKWVNLAPDNDFAKHSLASLKSEAYEENIKYNEKLFQHFADNYDKTLKDIKYSLPNKFKELLGNAEGKILDLGCGTGLVGEALKNNKNEIFGVDISSNMLAKAQEKNIYNELIHDDILSYLKKRNKFDWIVAADVFGYIGNIESIISLCIGSKLCFSIELNTLSMDNFRLSETGRYKHSENYVIELLKKNKFNDIKKYNIDLRLENGKAVEGIIFIAK